MDQKMRTLFTYSLDGSSSGPTLSYKKYLGLYHIVLKESKRGTPMYLDLIDVQKLLSNEKSDVISREDFAILERPFVRITKTLIDGQNQIDLNLASFNKLCTLLQTILRLIEYNALVQVDKELVNKVLCCLLFEYHLLDVHGISQDDSMFDGNHKFSLMDKTLEKQHYYAAKKRLYFINKFFQNKFKFPRKKQREAFIINLTNDELKLIRSNNLYNICSFLLN